MSIRNEHVVQMSIGEFARRSRLSAKALRLYDELGLLPPARVDEDSGYRFYEPGQLKQARLIAALRQLQVPLAEIKAIVALEPAQAADRWVCGLPIFRAKRGRIPTKTSRSRLTVSHAPSSSTSASPRPPPRSSSWRDPSPTRAVVVVISVGRPQTLVS
jgi:DNA-binding transcriptional MerR regulator